MTHHAKVARHKGCSHKGPIVKQKQWKNWTRDNAARGTSKGQAFGKRCRAQPECNNEIRDRGTIRQLCLKKETTTGNSIKRTKQETGATSGNVKTLYEALGQTLQSEVMQ
jgi:uncharacterized protein with gpF-like domain